MISDFFRSCAIECCQPSFTKANPCCHSDEIWNKMGYNSGCTIGMLIWGKYIPRASSKFPWTVISYLWRSLVNWLQFSLFWLLRKCQTVSYGFQQNFGAVLCCCLKADGLHTIKYKNLASLYYCVRATKSHIQNNRNHFTRTQSDRTMNWLPLQTIWRDLIFPPRITSYIGLNRVLTHCIIKFCCHGNKDQL